MASQNDCPGIDAVKTRTSKNLDVLDESGRMNEDFNVMNELLRDAGLIDPNLPHFSDVMKNAGKRVFAKKTLEKSGDDKTILKPRSLLKEIMYTVREKFGLTLFGSDFNLVSDAPPHMKATDVWKTFMGNLAFPSCLNVKDCFEDLLVNQMEMVEEDRKKAEKEKEFLDARDRALITIAKALEKDSTVTDGLLPILDLCKIKDELTTAKNSLSLTQDAILAQDSGVTDVVGGLNPYAESIKEAIKYFQDVEVTNTSNLNELGKYLRWKTMPGAYSNLRGRNESVRVYVPYERKWYPDGKNLPQYERAMTEDGYVQLTWKSETELSDNCMQHLRKYHVLIVDDTCIFNSGMRMIPALESALRMKPNFKVTIVDGVAGCGKTTYLKRLANMEVNPDIILTSSRASSDELKETVSCHDAMKYRIRTVDSYLMLKNWFSAESTLR